MWWENLTLFLNKYNHADDTNKNDQTFKTLISEDMNEVYRGEAFILILQLDSRWIKDAVQSVFTFYKLVFSPTAQSINSVVHFGYFVFQSWAQTPKRLEMQIVVRQDVKSLAD